MAAANMDSVGTFELALSLAKPGLITTIHKCYKTTAQDVFMASSPSNTVQHIAASTGTNQAVAKKLHHILNRHPELHFICIDVANGYSQHFVDFVQQARTQQPTKQS